MDTLKSFSLLTVILLILFYKIKFTLKTERKKNGTVGDLSTVYASISK